MIFLTKFVIFWIFIRLSESQILKVTKTWDDKRYEPTWESIDSRPLPEWYDEAKVGIFIHWGVYSVPSFGTEWFWINWKGSQTSSYIEFMKKNYKPKFSYQDFAPDFTAEHYNATQWVEIFKKSGANYIVLTSKHHEGYTMWPSTYSFSWNAKDVGPHRDLVKELADAVRKNSNMKFGLYYSLFEWFNPMFLQDKNNSLKTDLYVTQKCYPELLEIVNKYHPEIIWSDGDWEGTDTYWKSKEFISWLYNDSPVRDTVVTNDRWGGDSLCRHGGYFTCSDRFNPGVLQKHKYENAMTIDKKSWGHRASAPFEDYMTTKELINELVITVSTNGNILVNVGPNKYGLIEPIFVQRLTDMGQWLGINGDAIYKSHPWIYQNDTVTPNVWYTSKSQSDQRLNVYAIILDYPFDENKIDLYSLDKKMDSLSKVSMLGYDNNLDYIINDNHVSIKFPPKQQLDKNGLNWAWTLKIDIPL